MKFIRMFIAMAIIRTQIAAQFANAMTVRSTSSKDCSASHAVHSLPCVEAD
jgi:hypothetical protein